MDVPLGITKLGLGASNRSGIGPVKKEVPASRLLYNECSAAGKLARRRSGVSPMAKRHGETVLLKKKLYICARML